MKVLGVIPARYASTRFPGKPLAEIHGKSMVRRVYEQVKKSASVHRIVIATDDDRIVQHARTFDAEVVLTSPRHPSGTDRCAEVLEKMEETFDVIVNIQGDEPFIQPGQIDAVVECFHQDTVDIATLIKQIDSTEELFNPNKVKVVTNRWKEAMYFSRHPIPYCKTADPEHWLQHCTYYKHVGMYAYRRAVLKLISSLSPSATELTESLEQLRWIENGYTIRTIETTFESPAVDTPKDLEYIIQNTELLQFE
jgi:3-deoxy-manno-octulosonate cytidylyltransferase (CMP-KDO synthetase)